MPAYQHARFWRGFGWVVLRAEKVRGERRYAGVEPGHQKASHSRGGGGPHEVGGATPTRRLWRSGARRHHQSDAGW